MRKILLAVAVAGLTMGASMSATSLRLTSATLHDGGVVPDQHVYNGFGYHGANRSPQLSWSGAPAGTQSFAITCHDPDAPSPDAPRPGGWWHWLVVDLPASTTSLAENASAEMPAGALQTVTDFGPPGYGGPAPPPGKPHRYVFTVYALKVGKLGVKPKYPMATVEAAIKKEALASASFTVTFGHP